MQPLGNLKIAAEPRFFEKWLAYHQRPACFPPMVDQPGRQARPRTGINARRVQLALRQFRDVVLSTRPWGIDTPSQLAFDDTEMASPVASPNRTFVIGAGHHGTVIPLVWGCATDQGATEAPLAASASRSSPVLQSTTASPTRAARDPSPQPAPPVASPSPPRTSATPDEPPVPGPAPHDPCAGVLRPTPDMSDPSPTPARRASPAPSPPEASLAPTPTGSQARRSGG